VNKAYELTVSKEKLKEHILNDEKQKEFANDPTAVD